MMINRYISIYFFSKTKFYLLICFKKRKFLFVNLFYIYIPDLLGDKRDINKIKNYIEFLTFKSKLILSDSFISFDLS